MKSHGVVRIITARVISIVLALSLMVNSTPAASQAVVGLSQEISVGFFFWFHRSGVRRMLQGDRDNKPVQQKQTDRDAKIIKIKIFPGDISLFVGQAVHLSAVAYDRDDAPVGGVKVTWGGRDDDRKRLAYLSPTGEFRPSMVGKFKITAEAGGKKDQVTITVTNGPRLPKKTDAGANVLQIGYGPSTQVSSPVAQRSAQRSGATGKPGRFAHSRIAPPSPPLPLAPEDGWNGGNYLSSRDPANRVGDPAGNPLDGGAGSGNFQFAAPISSAPGRGINITLTAAYNSRLWNKSGNQITYDIDRGWPGPGWSLGFGKIMWMGSGGAMLVDADGTRHNYSGQVIYYNDATQSTYFTLHTTDGTFIDYSGQFFIYNGVNYGSATATLSNGTVISYFMNSAGAVYPTQIEDPNGNYAIITYVNNAGPRIQTITDSLHRVTQFYYDSNNLLTAINVPGLSDSTRTAVRFHYHQLTVNGSFSGVNPVIRDPNPWVVDAIYYPGTATGYWLNDSDSYSTYGMLAKVVEERGMSFSASSLTDMGSIFEGQRTRTETYNYPLTPSGLSDAPTYTSLIETWTRDGVINDSATTTFAVNETSTPRTVEIALPNGTKNKQYSYNHPGQFDDGLVYLDETRDASGTLLQSSSSTWEMGDYNTPRPIQVQATNNEINQSTTTTFDYNGSGCNQTAHYNQIFAVRNYGYGGELLRLTRTCYQNSSNYTNRHIFNLPLSAEVYAGDGTTRVSRTEYQYDGQTLANVPSVTMHDEAFDPYDDQNGQCYYVPDQNDPDCRGDCLDDQGNPRGNCDGYCPDVLYCPYIPATDYRGNVTQVTSYADAINLSGAVTETRRYDITGNLVTASTSCCEQTSFGYTSDTQYAYPQTKTRGSATDAYAQVKTSATYDFNTGLGRSETDANGRPSSIDYDADTLRTIRRTASTGAHTEYGYDDSAMTLTTTSYLTAGLNGPIANENVKLLNGRGQVRQEKALGPGDIWDYVDTAYDGMGQVSQQSRPYRSGDTKQWTVITYDALGRTSRVTAPDGSVTETYYNEKDFDTSDSYAPTRPAVASTAPGETTLVRDAWGRERWGRIDANRRLVEVVEPNPTGGGSVASGGYATTYGYNTLGNLIQVNQEAQTRLFRYDSLGRLTAQKLAEQNPSLNDAGTYVGSGTWSDIFTYDQRSNLTSRTDARGVKTVYTYNSDPLNRLQSVSWDTSGFGDNANPIFAAATVSYQYRQKSSPNDPKDVTQLASVTTSGVSTETYGYDDGEGRITSKTLTLSSRSSYPLATDYVYDPLDRVTDVLYPKQYGNGQQPRKMVHQNYDIASRLSSLTYDGQSFASNIVYNAASQTSSLNVGTGANQISESYTYNAQTGLLDHQTATRNNSTLLDLSYDYANGSGKRTGQLTKIFNNLDPNHNKDRGYSYDALGRLVQATGGPANSPIWTQTYTYDRYGNRLSVSASGNSAKGMAPSSPVMTASNKSGPNGSAVERASSEQTSGSIKTPANPTVTLPTDLLARNSAVELPSSSRSDESLSDSPPTLRAPAEPPQSGPPTFTDDPLKDPNNPESYKIKAIHITELRYWINALRNRRGWGNYNWVKPAASGGTVNSSVLISWEPIDEMRTALNQVLGPPSPAYADGLAQGLPILAIHITELRDRVKNNWNSCPTIDQFIKNFYQGALARQPNQSEFLSWSNQLRAAYYQGHLLTAVQYMGRQLFKSPEYANRNRSDHDYVYDLYWAYLQRGPDSSGWTYWTNDVIANGRDHTRLAFETDTTEFAPKVAALCAGSPGSSPIPSDGLASLTYDSATNRITTAGFAYDAAGNQARIVRIDGSAQRFQYDAANRLIQVRDDYGYVIESFTYGDSNERLIADEGGYRTYFDCEDGVTIAEYYEANGSGTLFWSKGYVYLGARLLSTLVPNGAGGEAIQFHHPDRLGTRLVTDPQNGTSFEQVSLPFGSALDAESTGETNRRFTSYDRSATTGLDYAYNRHYDSQQGRFTQVDPAGMKATNLLNPQTLNLYAYCANDPINRTDPNGLGLIHWLKKHWKIILVAVAIVVAVLLIPGGQALLGSFFQNAGHVIIAGASTAAESGGMATWLKVVLGGAIAAGIFGLGTLVQKKKQNMFEKSEEDAFDRLERLLKKGGACAEFLGPKGLDALKAMRNAPRTTRVIDNGNNPTGIIMDLPSLTGDFRTPNSVTFLVNGPFFVGVNKPALGTFPAGSHGAQLVALMHELGHLVRNAAGTGPLLPNDGGNSTLSQTNTDTMLNYKGKNGKTCKEEIFGAK